MIVLFFSQDRIGKNGKMIKIYKFRSMVPNAERILDEIDGKRSKNQKKKYLTNKKLVNDPRITPVGKFLRENVIR